MYPICKIKKQCMAAMLLLVQNRGEMTLTPTTVNTAGKQIYYTKHCWEADHYFNGDQKKVIDRESRLIPR